MNVQDFIAAHVGANVTRLVAALTQGNTTESYRVPAMADHVALVEKAQELFADVFDYEATARAAGWKTADMTPGVATRKSGSTLRTATGTRWRKRKVYPCRTRNLPPENPCQD